MRRSSPIAVSAAAALLACAGDELTIRQRLISEHDVTARYETWVRSMNNRDTDSLAALYHQVPELRVVWPDGRVSRGWEDVRTAQTAFFDGIERVNFVPQAREVAILSSTVAVTMLGYSLDVARFGGRRDEPASGIVTLIWVNDETDGLWKVHSQHVSVTPPPED